MNRRDFFHPRQLAQSAGQVLAAFEETTPEEDQPPQLNNLKLGTRAMATLFEVILPPGQADSLEIANEAFDLLDRLEAQLTVYRETSEVCRLNRTAAFAPVPVEGGLYELLALSKRIHAETNGAFDITAGALIKVWGFFKGPKRVPEPEELEAALACVGMQHVKLDTESKRVRYTCRGLEINLGAIGKGYALDRVAEFLDREWKIPAVLLHGGYSSVYAKGCPPSERRGWQVGLKHPVMQDQRIGSVWLHDRALATSAPTFQHLEHEGKRLGHILDPRTGWPSSGMASVSVVAPTCAEADALSTAFFIEGVETAREYCAQHPDVGVLLLPEAHDEPIVFGLSPTDLDLFV